MSKKKQCPYYEVCKVRLHPLSSTDEPNMVAHLGFRFLYTLIAWCVLGFNVNDGFFVSVCFFSLPVFMDCLKFSPLNNLRRYIRIFEIMVTGIMFSVSVLGILGIYTLKSVEETFEIITSNFIGILPSNIPIEIFWILLGLVVFVTLVDWFCNAVRIDEATKAR